MMIRTANNHEQLIRSIHDGINNSIGLVRSLPIKDERILAQLQNFEQALREIENVYGAIPKSEEMLMQQLHDRTIAESFKMTNKSRDYAEKQEENANIIESQSRRASPKGAARINAQASAKILHSLNQLIKINTQLLKVQSEYFAVTNKRGKDDVGSYQRVNRDFKQQLKRFEGNFKFPEF